MQNDCTLSPNVANISHIFAHNIQFTWYYSCKLIYASKKLGSTLQVRKEKSQLLVACLEEMCEGSLVASLDG